MDFESRVRNFLMYASDSWVSLLAVELLLLSGIACELFVIFRARSYPPGVLVVASLCGVLLPVTPLALASRQALTSERAALAALPGSGSDARMAVVELSHHLTLGAPLLAALLILAGIGLSRILIGHGARTPEAYAPVAGGGALALLVGGLGFNLAGLNAVVFPGDTFCGPLTYREFVGISVDEAAELWVFVALGAVALLAISFLWGCFLCVSWRPARPSQTSVILSTFLLTGSALLVGPSLPLMRETLRGRLPFQADWSQLQSDLRTPQLTGPDVLHGDVQVHVRPEGILVDGQTIEEPHLAETLASHVEKRSRELGLPDHRELVQPLLVAEPELTGRALTPLLAQVMKRAAAVQLGFLLVTTIERPLLGHVRGRDESGLVLALEPHQGSMPITFGADETYDAFARRAVELRRQGPVHLVLPTE